MQDRGPIVLSVSLEQPQLSRSGIVNDSNCYANETVGDPAYPLKPFQRVITVSLETMKIVRSLPKLEIAERSIEK